MNSITLPTDPNGDPDLLKSIALFHSKLSSLSYNLTTNFNAIEHDYSKNPRRFKRVILVSKDARDIVISACAEIDLLHEKIMQTFEKNVLRAINKPAIFHDVSFASLSISYATSVRQLDEKDRSHAINILSSFLRYDAENEKTATQKLLEAENDILSKLGSETPRDILIQLCPNTFNEDAALRKIKEEKRLIADADRQLKIDVKRKLRTLQNLDLSTVRFVEPSGSSYQLYVHKSTDDKPVRCNVNHATILISNDNNPPDFFTNRRRKTRSDVKERKLAVDFDGKKIFGDDDIDELHAWPPIKIYYA